MAYAALQLPVGVLFDALGPHRIICVFSALCVAGALLFASAGSVPLACAGRVLTGAGSGGAFLGIVVASSTFPGERMGIALGFSSIAGFGLGAFSAAAPFKGLCLAVGWRRATILTAALPAAITLALLPAACSSSGPGPRGATASSAAPVQVAQSEAGVPALSPWEAVRSAMSQRTVWLWGILGGGLDAQSNVVFGLLGYSVLRDGSGWEPETAALAISLVSLPLGLSNFAGSAVCSFVRTTCARCRLLMALAALGFAGIYLLIWTNKSRALTCVGLALIALSVGGEGTLYLRSLRTRLRTAASCCGRQPRWLPMTWGPALSLARVLPLLLCLGPPSIAHRWVMVAEGMNDDSAGGAVGGLVNTLMVLVDALAQPLCGWLTALAAGGPQDSSSRDEGGPASPARLTMDDFRRGLAPLMALYVVVVLCAFAVRDCQRARVVVTTTSDEEQEEHADGRGDMLARNAGGGR